MDNNNKNGKKASKKKRSNKKEIEKEAIAPLAGGYDDGDQAFRTTEIFLIQAMNRI